MIKNKPKAICGQCGNVTEHYISRQVFRGNRIDRWFSCTVCNPQTKKKK